MTFTKITDITIDGYIIPWSITDRSKADIVCIKAEKDEIIVKVGDQQYNCLVETSGPAYFRVAEALNQIMSKVLGEDYTGYLHNYIFADGGAYDEQDSVEGFYISG